MDPPAHLDLCNRNALVSVSSRWSGTYLKAGFVIPVIARAHIGYVPLACNFSCWRWGVGWLGLGDGRCVVWRCVDFTVLPITSPCASVISMRIPLGNAHYAQAGRAIGHWTTSSHNASIADCPDAAPTAHRQIPPRARFAWDLSATQPCSCRKDSCRRDCGDCCCGRTMPTNYQGGGRLATPPQHPPRPRITPSGRPSRCAA